MLRPPFLRGAKLDPSGILVEDPTNAQVKITLPMIKAAVAAGLERQRPVGRDAALARRERPRRPGRTSASPISSRWTRPMRSSAPPIVVGIGFRTAMLDLSDGSTPPDVLAQFGFDDSWTGIYLPELRIYIAPEGAQDLAFDASATNLLIGIGASAGITGDFEFTIVDQGSGPVTVSARFYDATGNCYGITKQADGNSATVTIPDHTRMVVDIDGGLTPYTASAKIGNAADTPGRLFDVDFGSDSSLTIVITAKGSQPNATATTLTITAALKTQSASPPAGTAQSPDNPGGACRRLRSRGRSRGYVTAAQDRVADVEPLRRSRSMPIRRSRRTGASMARIPAQARRPRSTAHPAPPFRSRRSWPTRRAPTDRIRRTTASIIPASGPRATRSPTRSIRTTRATSRRRTRRRPRTWLGNQAQDELFARSPTFRPTTPINIMGYASFESYDNPTKGGTDWLRNNDLATNRANGLAAIIAEISEYDLHRGRRQCRHEQLGSRPGRPGTERLVEGGGVLAAQTLPGTTTIGTVTRGPPSRRSPSRCQTIRRTPRRRRRRRGSRRSTSRSASCATTSSPSRSPASSISRPLRRTSSRKVVSPTSRCQPGATSAANNPADGIIDIRVVTQIDDATDVVSESIYFGADPADTRRAQICWLAAAGSRAAARSRIMARTSLASASRSGR